MATPIPIAKPASSGIAGLIGIVFLLALLGGEYYILTTRDAILHPSPQLVAQQLAQLQNAKKEKMLAAAAAHDQKNSRKANRKGGRKGQKQPTKEQAAGAGNAAAAAPPVPAGAPLDLSSLLGGSAADGPGMMDKALITVNEYENLGAGVALRFVLIVACLVLLFTQKPPTPKVGAMRRFARNPKTIVVPMQVIAVLLFFSSIALLDMGSGSGDVLAYGYPLTVALCLGCGFVGGQLRAGTMPVEGRLMAEKVRRDVPFGVVLKAEGGKFVNIPNPFRGTLVLGGAGAGKTYSIGEPFLEQFLQQGMCGIIYDFKFPVLAGAAQKALLYAQPAHEKLLAQYQAELAKGVKKPQGLAKPIRHRVINFLDMERTEKVNPLRPQDMPTPAYAMEYAATILTNLSPQGAKGGDNFFTKSAQAYLTGIIWYYRNNFPALCTIPHVVATAVYDDFTYVLHMLSEDPSSQVLVQSLITAVKQGAEKQIAGIIASLQVDMSGLATPEISWVLSPDEDPRLGDAAEGFSLNLNDPSNPTLLTIGNDPTLAKTFSPVISCVIAVALKLMNQQYKHPSFVLIDEGATIYVPGLETIPATARSNKVAMLYMTQDMAQLIDAYGKDKAQVLVSNLNNQFFGKINSAETARLVSDMVGKEDMEMVSISSGQSMGGTGGSNKGQSVSIQERQVFRQQDAYTLRQGEFVGQTVETPQSFFMAMMEREVEPGNYPIERFTAFAASKGVVDGRIRDIVEKQQALDESTGQGYYELDEKKEQDRAVRAGAGKAVKRAELIASKTAFVSGRKDLLIYYQAQQAQFAQLVQSVQLVQQTQDEQQAQSGQYAQQSQGSGLQVGTMYTNDGQDEPGADAMEEDWDWSSQANNGHEALEAAHYKPSPAEEYDLKERAKSALHSRGRTERVPDASNNENWQSEAQRHEANEALAAKQALERAAERVLKIVAGPTGSVLVDMVAENHARIRGEVAWVITHSGENSLSKAGLAAAETARKDAANKKDAQKPNNTFGSDAN